MRSDDSITSAQSLPRGAVFHRCALQVNPSSYSATFRGQEAGGGADAHAKAIVEKAAEIGISVLAVTNHNDVSEVRAFQAAAAGLDVRIIPGFELASSEGIHVLCLYPPSTSQAALGRFLGAFGILDTTPSSNLSGESFGKILEMVRDQGGLTIAAHVTTSKGLFTALEGQARIKAWKSENLFAIQIPGDIDGLPQGLREIVQNSNCDYKRHQAVSDSQAVAVVNAKDVTTPDDLEHPSASCLIKMSDVSIEGLRQAFLDPGSRIRLDPTGYEPEHEPGRGKHSELVSLTWKGGFLDGIAIHMNPNLNVLVGGRGAGKSTVIESLRYVLGLDPVGDEALKTHQGIVRGVLRSGTAISLIVRCFHPAKHEYRIERTVPNPPVVRDASGSILNLLPEDVFPHVEIYGQHEISELTRSREKLTRLLDRFVEDDPSLYRRKADVRRDLEKTRRAIVDVSAELRDIEERLAVMPGLQETLKRFQEAGIEDRLREQSLIVREERVLDSIPERLEPFRECMENLRQQIPIDRVFLSSRALEDLPGKEILSGADDLLGHLSRDLDQLVSQFEDALGRVEKGIDGIRSRWNERKSKIQATYEAILRELQKSELDGEEFIRLRRELENLSPLREREALLRELESGHLEQRRQLRTEWEDLKAEEFQRFERAAGTVGRKLHGHVRVKVSAVGNREPLLQLLKKAITGRRAEAIRILDEVEEFSLPQFVDTCREGPDAVMKTYGITAAQAKLLAGVSDETLMCIEELELPPATEIQLNTAPSGESPSWQVLEDLSTGQKATAVLLLLLLESGAPLIIDQPEDDLDNRFITEVVVPAMRKEKHRRQFVFSTHNANIPVLGDAELILGLTAFGEGSAGEARISTDHMGSIDELPVREMIEEILEGGRDAFETRRRKYGF